MLCRCKHTFNEHMSEQQPECCLITGCTCQAFIPIETLRESTKCICGHRQDAHNQKVGCAGCLCAGFTPTFEDMIAQVSDEIQQELTAMDACVQALEPLDEKARVRALVWLATRYVPDPFPPRA